MPKPAAGTPIDNAHSLASGLVHSWIFAEGSGTTTADGVSGQTATVVDTTWSTDADGPILANPGQVTLLANASSLPTAAMTVAMGYRKRDATNRISGAFGFVATTDAIRAGVHLPYSDGVAYFDFGGSSTGAGRILVPALTYGTAMTPWAFRVGAAGMSIWQGGVARASQAGHAVRASSSLAWGIGTHAGATDDQYDIAYLHVYNRELSDAEIVSVASDPYQMYATATPPSGSLLLRRRRAA